MVLEVLDVGGRKMGKREGRKSKDDCGGMKKHGDDCRERIVEVERNLNVEDGHEEI